MKTLNQKDFNAAIKRFKTQGETRQTDMHVLAVSALALVNENGDTTSLSNLHDAFSRAESALQGMFRAWVGIFTTQGMIIEETAEGFKPAVQIKPRVEFSRNDGIFRKSRKLDKKDVLNGSLSDLVELAKNFPIYEFASYRMLDAEAEYKPENNLRSVLRTLIRHAENAEKNGYPELAKAFQRGIDALGAGHMADGKAVVDKIKDDLVTMKTAQTLKKGQEASKQATKH